MTLPSTQISPEDILLNPEFYYFDFNPIEMTSRFLVMDEEIMRQAPFIDIRIEPMAKQALELPTKTLLQMDASHQPQRPTPHFIFHHAFVASTLMARSLDQIDAFFSLKEPWILRRLSDFKRHQGVQLPPQLWDSLLRQKIGFLCKPYKTGKTPVITATNVANNLIGDILRTYSQSNSVFLYSDPRSFLVSNLKKNDDTKRKMMGLLNGFIADAGESSLPKQYFDMQYYSQHLHQCALIWCLNMRELTRVQALYGDRVMPINMHNFTEDPKLILSRVATHFDHQASAEDLAKMTDDSVFGVNAKDSRQAYGTVERKRENDPIEQTNLSGIEAALDWVEPLITEWKLQSFC